MKSLRPVTIRLRIALIALGIIALALPWGARHGLLAQEDAAEEGIEEPLPIEGEDIIPALPSPLPTPPSERGEETAVEEGGLPPEERVEVTGEAREGEKRWNIGITSAVVMNYVFNESPDSFTIRYRLDIKGQANAATAVIRGEADINASVEGPLSKWPTGECKLEITIPKIPFELTFRKGDEERGSLKLVFKKAINEDWQSKCSFTDSPGVRFDTRGPPETWLTRALDKARPPLKDIVAEIGKDETTTSFVISKEVISDAPLGSGEIEGMGQVTIRPGGE